MWTKVYWVALFAYFLNRSNYAKVTSLLFMQITGTSDGSETISQEACTETYERKSVMLLLVEDAQKLQGWCSQSTTKFAVSRFPAMKMVGLQ